MPPRKSRATASAAKKPEVSLVSSSDEETHSPYTPANPGGVMDVDKEVSQCDEATAAEPTVKAMAPGHRKRQLTLSGEAVDALKASGKRQKKDPAVKPQQSRSTLLAYGEIKPSGGAKSQRRPGPPDAAGVSPSLEGVAASSLLEESLSNHIKNSLVLASMKEWHVTIQLDSGEGATGENPTMPTATEVSSESVEKSKKGNTPQRNAAGSPPNPTTVTVHAALPCLQHFILRECARIAEVVVKEGGGELGSDPIQRSLELLGFLLSGTEAPHSLCALMTLACPACRFYGIPAGTNTFLCHFLIWTQRASLSELQLLSQDAIYELLWGTVCNPEHRCATQVPLLEQCPYGEAHAFLFEERFMSPEMHVRGCRYGPMVHYVPFTEGSFDVIVHDALHHWKDKTNFLEANLAVAMEKEQRDRVGSMSVDGIYVGSSRRKSTARKSRPVVPTLSASCRRRLKPNASAPHWAKNILDGVLAGNDEGTSVGSEAVVLYRQTKRFHEYLCRQDCGYFVWTCDIRSVSPRSHPIGTMFQDKELQYREILFMQMKIVEHIADGLRRAAPIPKRDDEEQQQQHSQATPAVPCLCECQCSAAPGGDARGIDLQLGVHSSSALLIENHLSLMVKLRHRRNGLVLTDDMPTTSPATTPRNFLFYSLGSHTRFRLNFDAIAPLPLSQILDCATEASAIERSDIPALDIPAHYIQTPLKRHQMESVQWMLQQETEGRQEYSSVPLYHIAQATLDVTLVGHLYYCAAVSETIVVPAVANLTSGMLKALSCRIHGGLLCDEVGLGKTLAVLALSACDRAQQEKWQTLPSSDDDALSSANAATKEWVVRSSSRGQMNRNLNQTIPLAFFKWAFGESNFSNFSASYNGVTTPLPRATLIVMPLSIVSQWISEIRRFYPQARYLLFYGSRRSQFTIDDFRQADFVLTTYETAGVHLRQEVEGTRYWLGQNADEADDKVCSAAVQAGWKQCLPSTLFDATQRYAEQAIWPCLDLPNAVDLSRGETVVRVHKNAPSDNEEVEIDADTSNGVAFDDWSFCQDINTGRPLFRCPSATIEVVFRQEDGLEHPRIVYDAIFAAVLQQRGKKKESAAAQYSALSVSFLDNLWDLMVLFIANFGSCRDDTRSQLLVNLHEILLLTKQYPAPTAIRHRLIRLTLLPLLWSALKVYWTDMKDHYSEVADAEKNSNRAVRLVDFSFHRIVLDESQKCSNNSLLHLLEGERRWAISGTPINNNNAVSMAAPLLFLGARAASSAITRCSTSPFAFLRPALYDHLFNMLSTPLHIDFSSTRPIQWLLALRGEPLQSYSERSSHFCTCAGCFQRKFCGGTSPETSLLPSHLQLWHPERIDSGTKCLPSTIIDILTTFMIRHQRTDQVKQELALPPIQFQAHVAPLMEEERKLYKTVATVVMSTASRLHRQGLLTTRMGRAMQWVQELCRLCLHPTKVSDEQLLRGDTEQRIMRGALLSNDATLSNSAEVLESILSTFVVVSPQQALEWAKSCGEPAPDGKSGLSLPQETSTNLMELCQVPPLLPQCGVCLDEMAAPTLLTCLHLFCKECIVQVAEASRTVAGNIRARCPYCRDPKCFLNEKRVITLMETDATVEAEDNKADTPPPEEAAETVDLDDFVQRIGNGTRVKELLQLLDKIWAADPHDGILVFSKFPAMLQLANTAITEHGYSPFYMMGSSTLVQRQKIIRALQDDGLAVDPEQPSVDSSLKQHRILLVTSRSANAGLNLTFANHIIFLEPNLNPALEQQAIGRIHRFGQLKQVVVHHLYAPGTIEELIYTRSQRLLQRAPVGTGEPNPDSDTIGMSQHRAEFGRPVPSEILMLLQYPIVASPLSRPQ